MNETSLAVLAQEIERRAHTLAGVLLTEGGDGLKRLRDETARLHTAITEATRLSRLKHGMVERGAAILTPVIIKTGGFSGFCLVRNLTEHGMTAKVFACLPADQPVRVCFSSDDGVDGTVVHSAQDRIEIQFDRPVILSRLLATAARRRKPRRPARLDVEGEIELVAHTRAVSADVIDVSQHGLKVLTAPLKAGQLVNVDVGGFELRPAVVRWSRSGATGLKFLRALSLDELRLWNP